MDYNKISYFFLSMPFASLWLLVCLLARESLLTTYLEKSTHLWKPSKTYEVLQVFDDLAGNSEFLRNGWITTI